MSDSEQLQGPGGKPPGGVMGSVHMAFNMGVAACQQGGAKDVIQVASELRETIYTQISQAYGEHLEESFIRANVEYFVQIALMGYIIPEICYYDEDFKTRLFTLIEQKLQRTQQQQQPPPGGDSGIIVS
ncbi:MAG: hypothetical protein IH874_09135 [Candidatus Dadabacteria bacterium]|nr:hypothetical protein [Candidatus Dadabacteria bacterium]